MAREGLCPEPLRLGWLRRWRVGDLRDFLRQNASDQGGGQEAGDARAGQLLRAMIAARKAGDVNTEEAARRELAERHGCPLRFGLPEQGSP
jgi:hypothetical protein